MINLEITSQFAFASDKARQELSVIVSAMGEAINRLPEEKRKAKPEILKVPIAFPPTEETIKLLNELSKVIGWKKIEFSKEGLCNLIICHR